MPKILNIILTYSFIFLSACTSQEIENIELIDVSQKLSGEKIPISTFIYQPRGIALMDNKIVIHDDVDNNMFKFLSYPKVEYKFSWGLKGKGPDEVEYVSTSGFSAKENTVSFLEVSKMKTYQVDTNEQISLKNLTYLMNSQGALNGFAVLNDSLFIASLEDEFAPDKEHLFLFPQGHKGPYFGNFPDEGINFDSHLQKVVHYNKVLVASEEEERIMIFYNRLNLVKIYNFGGNLLKEIVLEEMNKGISNNPNWISFGGAVGTENYVYTLFVNGPEGERIEDFKSFVPDILVWNWEGELVKRYVLDKPIVWFVVSEKYKMIYGLDLEGGSKIYQFPLPDENNILSYRGNRSLLRNQQDSQNSLFMKASNRKYHQVISHESPRSRENKVKRLKNIGRILPSFAFENDYYRTIIPSDYKQTESDVDLNHIYQRNYRYNYNAFYNRKLLSSICGATIAIYTYFPEENTPQALEKLYQELYTMWFRDSNINYRENVERINNKSITSFYFEEKRTHPNGQEMSAKQSGWIWKDNGKVFYSTLSACEKFEDNLEHAKSVIRSLEAK